MWIGLRLRFNQWKVLHSLKDYIVLLGGRRTGKSYTAYRLAVKQMEKGNNVIFISDDMPRSRFNFESLVDYAATRDFYSNLKINRRLLKIESKGKEIRFCKIGDLEIILKIYYRNKDVVIVADDIDDIPKLMCYLSYLKNRYLLTVKKTLITGIPNGKYNKKSIIRNVSNCKLYIWKGEEI